MLELYSFSVYFLKRFGYLVQTTVVLPVPERDLPVPFYMVLYFTFWICKMRKIFTIGNTEYMYELVHVPGRCRMDIHSLLIQAKHDLTPALSGEHLGTIHD